MKSSRIAALITVSMFLSIIQPALAAVVIGTQTVGSTADSGDANWMNGSKVTTPAQSVSATSVTVYVGAVDSAPNNQFQVAIYADNGGIPGALLAASATGTLTANGWNTLPVTATLQAST